jgi:acyl-CoA thioesterase I
MQRYDRRTLPRFAICLIGAFFVHSTMAVAGPTLPHVAHRIEMQERLHITCFGSSSTEGIGATSKDRSYPSRLSAALTASLPLGIHVTVLNRGNGGEDVDDMMLRLQAIIDEKPDLVIWQTGSNDALRNVPLERFVADTRSGIQRMLGAGIDVMLMEPQLSDRLAHTGNAFAYRDAVRSLGQEMRLPVVRRYDLMQQWLSSGQLTAAQMMSGDGLHMTDGGYDLLGKSVAEMILTEGRPSSPHVAAK